jgi:transcriptional regulator with PAS, ATPase and Fis domain
MRVEKIQTLGDVKDINVDVRIITATNKNLKQMIKSGQFRSDLYYRINILNIDLPPH